MEQINFLATDGISLNGFLSKSNEKTDRVILAVHGMSSNAFKERDRIIAKEANQRKTDYFCFNNRGSELVKYIRKDFNGQKEKFLGGTSYEDVLEGYEDIIGAILKLKELGYQSIYLQGHSLGCTKIVYTYHELFEENEIDLLSHIKGVILLSLIDIPMALKFYLGENYTSYLKLAEEKEEKNEIYDLMPKKAFIHPISVKTFLRYARDYQEIDFAKYGKDQEFHILNQIQVPLFMRFGNDQEMIEQEAGELVTKLSNLITNPKKDIDYIDGADHGYHGKEELLAKQIMDFIEKYQ